MGSQAASRANDEPWHFRRLWFPRIRSGRIRAMRQNQISSEAPMRAIALLILGFCALGLLTSHAASTGDEPMLVLADSLRHLQPGLDQPRA
jgi:hypothetical protein